MRNGSKLISIEADGGTATVVVELVEERRVKGPTHRGTWQPAEAHRVEVSIDLIGIAFGMARSALENTSGKAGAKGGMIKAAILKPARPR